LLQFAIVEVVVTSVQDGFPRAVKRYLICHELLVLAVCVASFLLGLLLVTQVRSDFAVTMSRVRFVLGRRERRVSTGAASSDFPPVPLFPLDQQFSNNV